MSGNVITLERYKDGVSERGPDSMGSSFPTSGAHTSGAVDVSRRGANVRGGTFVAWLRIVDLGD